MKIGEASAASGCHLETIRYYERIGLLPIPARRSNGYRQYSKDEVARLRFITRGRELGFSLDEIKSLMRLSERKDMSCAEVDRLAREQLVQVKARMRELAKIARELERTIKSCVKQSCGNCAILGALQGDRASEELTKDDSGLENTEWRR
jgi:MerR family transcriptional regulator, mercuric resistance operon regulatory protein